MSPTCLLRFASRRVVQPHILVPKPKSSPIQRFSQSSLRYSPQKDAQDRNSINTESSENTKSSTDNDAAAQEAAYDPGKTSPESEMESAGGGKKGSGNPLEVSGANREVSKQNDPKEGGAENSPKNGSSSGSGSSKKGQATP